MPVDYIVASLPELKFGEETPITAERFREIAGEVRIPAAWNDLETQLRNAIAEARGGEKYRRPAHGCSLYWRGRILACFQEKDVYRRQEALDRVWWDAAGELARASSPLGKGALAAYAVRLGIAERRAKISKDKGNEAFDRLARETKNDNNR